MKDEPVIPCIEQSSLPIQNPKFKIQNSLLLLFLAALEAGVLAWRHNVPVSTAAVFSLPMASEAMQHPGSFQRSIDVYHADRSGELKLPGPNGSSLAVFYFEWDSRQPFIFSLAG